MANENQNNNDGTVWAIVDSGTRRLMGRVPTETTVGTTAPVLVKDAVELQCELTRIPTPNGLAEMYTPAMHPVDMEDGPVDVLVSVANLRVLDALPDGGARYFSVRDNLLRELQRARMQRLGIVEASEMPKGGRIIGH